MFTHLRPAQPVSLVLAMRADGLGCLDIPEAQIPRIITRTTMQAVRIMVAAMQEDITAEAVTVAAGIIDLDMTMRLNRALSLGRCRRKAALPTVNQKHHVTMRL